jgi:hypothetical protein
MTNKLYSQKYPNVTFSRYELRTISPHFGQTTVAIYSELDEAREGLRLKLISQDLPVILYDAETDLPVLPGTKL